MDGRIPSSDRHKFIGYGIKEIQAEIKHRIIEPSGVGLVCVRFSTTTRALRRDKKQTHYANCIYQQYNQRVESHTGNLAGGPEQGTVDVDNG